MIQISIIILLILISIMCWVIKILISFNRYLNIIKLQKSIGKQLISQMKNLKRDDFINDFKNKVEWTGDKECKITIYPKSGLHYINIPFTVSPTSIITS